MNHKLLFLFLLLTSYTTLSLAQSNATRDAWRAAQTHANNQDYSAAKPYLLEVYKEMPRPLCCYFLGLAYDLEGVTDSAEYFYQKCMDNSRQPQMRAWDNLCRMHLRQLDFDKAYAMAKEGLTKYPGNEVVLDEFKEICKWSYCIKHEAMPTEYLSNYRLQESYKVGTITEQYLIIKNIRSQEDEFLHVGNRLYKGTFEEWNCRYNNSKQNHVVKFELKDQDLDREIQRSTAKAKTVYNDKAEELRVRIGAMLSLTPLTDKMMKDILLAEEEEIRLCACTETNGTTSENIKKKCQKDSSEMVKVNLK